MKCRNKYYSEIKTEMQVKYLGKMVNKILKGHFYLAFTLIYKSGNLLFLLYNLTKDTVRGRTVRFPRICSLLSPMLSPAPLRSFLEKRL